MASMSDLSDQETRYIEALAGNLHNIAFHNPFLSESEKDAAIRNVIATCKNQIDPSFVSASLDVLHSQLRDRVKLALGNVPAPDTLSA